ncbi:MAG TPA: calcium-binding protein [Acidimicrobiales bacterium]|nr:calcium-binding protein [Acidimicrobiales bacterium]
MALVVAVSAGLVNGLGGNAASAAVTAVKGSAFGFFGNVSLFGGPLNTRGPAPTVDLPPGGSAPITANSATGSVIYGPAVIFSSGPITVSTQGTTGAGGSVSSSTVIQSVNTSQSEIFTAARLESSCSASETGVSGSTTVTNGTIILHDPNPDTSGEEGEEIVTIPSNPTPNTTYEGTVANVNDNFRAVFNEQVVNPDGSITVYAYHLYLLGPTAVGDVFVGKAECGVITTTTSTTSSTNPSSTTSTTPTTLAPTTTTSSTTSTTTAPTTTTSSTTTTTVPGPPTCDGLPATIVGTAKNDLILGTPGDDVIVGLGGVDSIDGAGGNDAICGGDGDDLLSGGAGDNRIFGEAGNDRMAGAAGADYFEGGEGNDRVSAGDGDDTIDGGTGANILLGGLGNDFFSDSAGDDLFLGGPGDDFLSAFGGPLAAGDRFEGGDGNDVIIGFMQGGVYVGGPGDDSVTFLDSGTYYGGPGEDVAAQMRGGTFYGGDQRDRVFTMFGGTFYGEAGEDEVDGLNGTGIFLGGADHDRADSVVQQALFCGGLGDDNVVLLSVANQFDGSPDPAAGGTFYGEEGTDEVGLFFPGGTFFQDGPCPVAFVPPPAIP